jgi:hypothetical protein
MTAVVSKSRLKQTWLTGAAGLLLLAAALVMMVCSAPTARARLHAGVTRPATESVTSFCGQPASGGDPAKARACRLGPSALSAWTKPYIPSTISPGPVSGLFRCPEAKPAAC